MPDTLTFSTYSRDDLAEAARTKAIFDAARAKVMLALQEAYFELLGEVPMDRSCVEFCAFVGDVLIDQVSAAQWAEWKSL